MTGRLLRLLPGAAALAAVLAVPAVSEAAGTATFAGISAVEVTARAGAVTFVPAASASVAVSGSSGAGGGAKASGGVLRVGCAACTVRLRISVPAGIRVKADVRAGSITAEKTMVPLELSTAGGSIRALDVGGAAFTARSGSGDVIVSLAHPAKVVDIATGSGFAGVTTPYGSYRVSATSKGLVQLDIARTTAASAPLVKVVSATGDVLVAQRYVNMS